MLHIFLPNIISAALRPIAFIVNTISGRIVAQSFCLVSFTDALIRSLIVLNCLSIIPFVLRWYISIQSPMTLLILSYLWTQMLFHNLRAFLLLHLILVSLVEYCFLYCFLVLSWKRHQWYISAKMINYSNYLPFFCMFRTMNSIYLCKSSRMVLLLSA